MNPIFTYSLARLALFVACLAVVSLVGARGVLALLLALVISMLLSLVLLGRLRNAAAKRVAGGVGKRLEDRVNEIRTSDEAVEDAAAEPAQSGKEQSGKSQSGSAQSGSAGSDAAQGKPNPEQ